jgi:hypothetical protein
MEHFDLFNIIGILGSACYFLGYGLLSFQVIKGDGYAYITFNLAGALLVIYSLTEHFNLPSIITQVGWVFISVVGLFNVWRKKSRLCTFNNG